MQASQHAAGIVLLDAAEQQGASNVTLCQWKIRAGGDGKR
jgi:hypothetical protein